MKNEKTGMDERCATCRYYAPSDITLRKGNCTKHWRLNQKHDTKTAFDLWCQYYEAGAEALKTQAQEKADARNLEELKRQDYEGETEGPEDGAPMDRESLGAGMQYPGEANPVPAPDYYDVVLAITRELHTQVKELWQMDADCIKSMAAAAKSGDRMALAEIGAMLRAFDMIRTNVERRINDLKISVD